ncbi:zinc ribbon domain-containing protein [Halospeciosus flavus]|uniref:Zinc ribbon domain-containing protein n=1 Tax=Halospeciosus flavus TaxID=3032283 RepID=A0ABD5Z317_9EURY|nr:zinc ribbon domain-containing protein [Halospeciosus flavus]
MASEKRTETVYCRECGAEIRRAAEICPECGVRQRPPPSTATESLFDGRNPLVAAILSAIFPGLGHIYAREVEMGLFFAVSFLLAVLSLFVFVGVVLVPAIWLYALYDAAKTAERRDRELSRPPVVE